MRTSEKRAQQPTITFAIEPDEPVYVIGVVSQLVKLPIWTLRILDREGIVKAKRRSGRARLYSLHDLRLLVRIRQLCIQERVNLAGVRMILHMEMHRMSGG